MDVSSKIPIATTTVAKFAGEEEKQIENEHILELLECCVCLDHITPPIRQCQVGHLLCTECFARLTTCPTCRGQLSNDRNLAMEQVASLLHFPCRYSLTGCTSVVTLTAKVQHEKNCKFQLFKCPFHGQCKFSGQTNEVVPHLKKEHAVSPVKINQSGRLFYRAKHINRRNVWTFLFEWDGQLFRFVARQMHSSVVGSSGSSGGERSESTTSTSGQPVLSSSSLSSTTTAPAHMNRNGGSGGASSSSSVIVAHVQLVGPQSKAEYYSYDLNMFDSRSRKSSKTNRFAVTSSLRATESLCAKEEAFVCSTSYARRYVESYTNQLNFIILMRGSTSTGEPASLPSLLSTTSSTSTAGVGAGATTSGANSVSSSTAAITV